MFIEVLTEFVASRDFALCKKVRLLSDVVATEDLKDVTAGLSDSGKLDICCVYVH